MNIILKEFGTHGHLLKSTVVLHVENLGNRGSGENVMVLHVWVDNIQKYSVRINHLRKLIKIIH